jgi:DNA-binding NtrC family response regulator
MDRKPTRILEVLVVDDEPIVCKTLKRALSKPGFEVEVFEDPILALERFDEHAFDIVVADVVMGDTDGVQVLRHVLRRSPATKVIIMTAFACMDLAREAMEHGAFDFIAKPFTADDVRAVVGKAAQALLGTQLDEVQPD